MESMKILVLFGTLMLEATLFTLTFSYAYGPLLNGSIPGFSANYLPYGIEAALAIRQKPKLKQYKNILESMLVLNLIFGTSTQQSSTLS